jgi:hypothetical protein
MIRESSLELFSFKMERDGTSGVDAGSIRVDLEVAGAFASCCGVNLAVRRWGAG